MDPITQAFIQGAAGASGEGTYIDDVFSTTVYRGTAASGRVVTNNIDMAGEGAMLWVKRRDGTNNHIIVDSERGPTKYLYSNSSTAETDGSSRIQSFSSTGYVCGDSSATNGGPGDKHVSWTFRKQKGFFDIVTWDGDAVAGRQLSHSLGGVPGAILVKCYTNSGAEWMVYHRDMDPADPGNYRLHLDQNVARVADTGAWNNTEPTATHFTVGGTVNESSRSYVAYLLAGGASSAATAKSVEFDGSGDWLSVPATPSTIWDVGNIDFTMECWAKFDSHGSHDGIFHNVTNSGWTGGSWIFEPVSGNLCFYYYNTGGALGNVIGGVIPLGQWQHMAIVKSGSTIKIFQDGILTGEAPVNGTIRPGTNPLLIGGQCVGRDMDGKVSNVRITMGQALYTSSFRPSTEPLTTTSQGAISSNVKLLCCNQSTVNGYSVSPGTITTNGNPAVYTLDIPFDDPEGYKFGGEGDQNIIKCGRYEGNQNTDGPEINLGWEPQYLLIKRISDTEDWMLLDNMRRIESDGNDNSLRANTDVSEDASHNWLDLTSTGFKIKSTANHVNGYTDDYIYIAIRRSDGQVGKPPEAGTDAFAMAYGSTTHPSINGGIPIDFAMVRQPATTENWYTGSRLTGYNKIYTNTSDAMSSQSNFVWDYMDGWQDSSNSNYLSWMWKRHAGFDVLTYKGNSVQGREIPHSMNVAPEMVWVRRREGDNWCCGHKGLNGGTTPWNYIVALNTDGIQSNAGADRFNNTAPTAKVISVGNDGAVNNSSYNYLAMLFASVDGISKVGYHDGDGTTRTFTCGFAPRYLIIKNITTAYHWFVMDTVRGWGPVGSTDKHLQLNRNNAQGNWDFGAPTSTGFTLTASDGSNQSGDKYIWYAHA